MQREFFFLRIRGKQHLHVILVTPLHLFHFLMSKIGADITISPMHKGGVGRVDENKGLSLRFPRYLRTRSDKTIYDATTSDTLATMYSNQKNLQQQHHEEEK